VYDKFCLYSQTGPNVINIYGLKFIAKKYVMYISVDFLGICIFLLTGLLSTINYGKKSVVDNVGPTIQTKRINYILQSRNELVSLNFFIHYAGSGTNLTNSLKLVSFFEISENILKIHACYSDHRMYVI
jgi:hypothetical protein